MRHRKGEREKIARCKLQRKRMVAIGMDKGKKLGMISRNEEEVRRTACIV